MGVGDESSRSLLSHPSSWGLGALGMKGGGGVELAPPLSLFQGQEFPTFGELGLGGLLVGGRGMS